MLDDTLLGDPVALAALDTTGVLRSAATAGAQVRSAAHATLETGVLDLEGTRPRSLVLVRRPGSSTTAAGVLAALLGPGCPVPVVVLDAVPSWIGPLDVVVAHTADASDGELAESVGRAVSRGAEVVLSAPPDGPVASAGAGRARIVEPRLPVPPGLDLPRALAVGLVVVAVLGLLPTELDPRLDALADVLDGEAERDSPSRDAFVNPAKSLALRLAEHTPLLWGTDALAAAVAEHAAASFATHAGVVAHAAGIAHAATATALGALLDAGDRDDIFRDPFDDDLPDSPAPPPRLVLIGTAEENPVQTALRRTGRDRSRADLLHPVDEVARGVRHAALLRAGLIATRFDLAAVYLGLATRTIVR